MKNIIILGNDFNKCQKKYKTKKLLIVQNLNIKYYKMKSL